MKNKMLAIVAVLVLVAGGALGIFYNWTSDLEENYSTINYMIVKVDNDDNWSIIDKHGNVVVKNEYGDDTNFSFISKNGTFWLERNGKYMLYSVKSPKKPLTKVEYDKVTIFNNGVAFAAIEDEPICLINEKGELVKKLRDDIDLACPFKYGLAIVRNRDGLHGYVNTKGDIVIKPQYEKAVTKCNNGYMLVRKDEESPICLIDKTGKTIKTFDPDTYSKVRLSNDGMIALEQHDEEREIRLMSVDGRTDLTTKPEYGNVSQIEGGPKIRNYHPIHD